MRTGNVMRTSLEIPILGLMLFLAGCAGSSAPEPVEHAMKPRNPAPEQQRDADKALIAEARAGAGALQEKGIQQGAKEEAEPLPRKIIYTAEVKLIVQDLTRAEQELKQLLKDHKGIIAQSDLTGSAGAPRQGHWRLRVPVDQFDPFLEALVKLGVPEKNHTDSEDVTDQYYDLEARIKNKKAEEESLRKLLEQTTGKMEDILAVRRELNQVRGEIDRQEGQRKRLANLSALTTIELTLQEIKDYVPPQAPTFGDNIAGIFGSSVSALKAFGRGIVYVVVALAPWLVVLALFAVPAWLLLRRRPSRRPQEPLTVEPGAPPPAPAGQ